MSLLEVMGLNSYYGDSHILFDVSLRVEKREVVALLGRNGAGKSTTLKEPDGRVTPRTGSIRFDGTEASSARRLTASPGSECSSSCTRDRRNFGSPDVEEENITSPH